LNSCKKKEFGAPRRENQRKLTKEKQKKKYSVKIEKWPLFGGKRGMCGTGIIPSKAPRGGGERKDKHLGRQGANHLVRG